MNYKYINTGYINSVTGGDKNTIAEILEMFREQVNDVTSNMKKFLNENDYFNLSMIVHKVKSSVAIMGMEQLENMLNVFERQSREGEEKEKYGDYILRFEHDTSEAIIELENYINSL
ncbi:MAG TPA: Hpt domain-containing protein [Bacteroidales bacterium]|nr:Hpt domain-containing protein [Bacteroidales bacterium]HQG35597.1 Hpt domain-containing protein [Bacteroidales bacterium]HQG51907.1 Hpt domain-containing protein [Bacteroidales bacterium]HQJ19602.1 Hpt domain-containing protein [Bacteroidales bacterium]